MGEMNKWQARYTHGYRSFVDRTYEKKWHDCDRVPKLDKNGCSGIVILFFKYMSNPVGMDTPEHSEGGFFHAQAGPYGCWYTLETRNGKASRLIYMPDGWKRCNRKDQYLVERLQEARRRIENGDWHF